MATFFAPKLHQPIDPQSKTTEKWDLIGGTSGSTATDTLDYRSKLLPNTDALEKTSQDLYASTRLIKAQLRAKLVEEGKAGQVPR